MKKLCIAFCLLCCSAASSAQEASLSDTLNVEAPKPKPFAETNDPELVCELPQDNWSKYAVSNGFVDCRKMPEWQLADKRKRQAWWMLGASAVSAIAVMPFLLDESFDYYADSYTTSGDRARAAATSIFMVGGSALFWTSVGFFIRSHRLRLKAFNKANEINFGISQFQSPTFDGPHSNASFGIYLTF